MAVQALENTFAQEDDTQNCNNSALLVTEIQVTFDSIQDILSLELIQKALNDRHNIKRRAHCQDSGVPNAGQISSWRDALLSKNLSQTTLRSVFSNQIMNSSDTDTNVLIFSHPIPAYALYQVKEACHEIDVALCGSENRAIAKVAVWRSMRPLEYLAAKPAKGWWKAKLEELGAVIESGEYNSEAVARRLEAIAESVEKFESAHRLFHIDFVKYFQEKFPESPVAGRLENEITGRDLILQEFLEKLDRVE